jgi:outer membrane protein OmpA-like peptidoglycan-associated protein
MRYDVAVSVVGFGVLLVAAAAVAGDGDRDRDRIPDAVDRCPDEPETYNGVDDEDGCPDSGRVITFRDRIEFSEPERILFRVDSAEVPADHPILDAVVHLLQENPQLVLLEVQGHGDDTEERSVSVARARAVRRALIARGVAARRLVARGYAYTRPVCTKTSDTCRLNNRRVRFQLLRVRPTP